MMSTEFVYAALFALRGLLSGPIFLPRFPQMGKKASTDLVMRQLEHSLHMTSKEIEGLGRNSAVCDYDLGLLDQQGVKKCLADSLKLFVEEIARFKTKNGAAYRMARQIFSNAYLNSANLIVKVAA